MAETTTRGAVPLDHEVHLALEESLVLDVAYCDIVRARGEGNEGPFKLRFRGTRQPDQMRVRFFAPLIQIEGGLLQAKAIAQPVRTEGITAQDAGALAAVPLVQRALTFTKLRKGNGEWYYRVDVRDSTAAVALTEYLQALRAAAEQAAPVLSDKGYTIGAAEIISMAGELVAIRRHRQTRDTTHTNGSGA